MALAYQSPSWVPHSSFLKPLTLWGLSFRVVPYLQKVPAACSPRPSPRLQLSPMIPSDLGLSTQMSPLQLKTQRRTNPLLCMFIPLANGDQTCSRCQVNAFCLLV